jgi:periodic tryptophan protein 2
LKIWTELTADGKAMLIHFRKGTILHRISFSVPVTYTSFSPNGKYIAITQGNKFQIWRTPNMTEKQFAPFELHREYTGHHDEVVSVEWSKTSRQVATSLSRVRHC